jgi:hypothetical protein
MKWNILIVTPALALSFAGCRTTAPSHYELNRRSGLDVSIDAGTAESPMDTSAIRTGRLPAKDPQAPARTAPVIEKVWVYDQIINDDQWLQGTWIFLEVDQARWLPEVDIGQASFLETGKISAENPEPNP